MGERVTGDESHDRMAGPCLGTKQLRCLGRADVGCAYLALRQRDDRRRDLRIGVHDVGGVQRVYGVPGEQTRIAGSGPDERDPAEHLGWPTGCPARGIAWCAACATHDELPII